MPQRVRADARGAGQIAGAEGRARQAAGMGAVFGRFVTRVESPVL